MAAAPIIVTSDVEPALLPITISPSLAFAIVINELLTIAVIHGKPGSGR
jgi:hypothetical protein